MNQAAIMRTLHFAGGVIAASAACVGIGIGLLDSAPGSTPPSVVVIAFAAVVGVLLAAVARRLRFVEPTARSQRRSRLLEMAVDLADVELGLALVAGCEAAIVVSGGIESSLYPLLYGVVAFCATFLRRYAVIAVVAVAIALEGAGWWRSGVSGHSLELAFHIACILGAAVAHAVFLRGLVSRQRRDHEARLDDEIRKQRESARDYRLIASSLGAESRAPRSREEEEMRLALGAVENIRESLFHTLTLIKRSIEARTCILLWVDERTEELKIKELVTDSEDITERERIGQEGVLGAVIRDRTLLCLPQTRPGQVPYYEAKHAAGAFLGLPVMDGPHLRGLLCADRDEQFTEREANLLSKATEQIVRLIHSEQVFSAVERAKYEHERFYHASAMLGSALTLEQVMATAFDAAAQIADFDVGIVTMYDRERKRHRVYSARVRPGCDNLIVGSLDDFEFRDNSGLASMVVKNKHYLPAGGELRDAATPLFTKKVGLKNVESLLVLPLISADEAVGTFTLASASKNRFGNDIREMLRVIANQVAISLQNALMYKQMETMATTDGLTGLTNHRTFQERFGQLLDRSARHDHQAAVLLCDVDHFKNVNDTYGHPVGDEVLRRVASVLRNAVRKIDIPARYGGEEFAVVLEATDEAGAILLANRIREDVANLELESDKGTFQVTMSVGIATFPADAEDRAALIERSDMALYHAKESGRNRVVSYRQYLSARKTLKAS